MNGTLNAMDLTKWIAGDLKGFGEDLRRERLLLPPDGWQQQSLARYILSVLGDIEESARDKRPVFDNPNLLPFGGEPDPRDVFLANRYKDYLDEVEKESPGFLRNLNRFEKNMLRPLESVNGSVTLDINIDLDALERHVKRWRSRIANVESGRKVSRQVVELIVYAVEAFKRIMARPQESQGDSFVLPQLPFFGEVPRNGSLSDFSHASGLMEVMPRWALSRPDLIVTVGTDEHEPVFFKGELLGIQRTGVLAYGIAALVHGPGNEFSLRCLADTPDGLEVRPLLGAAGVHWTPAWTLIGYVVARELSTNRGIRVNNATRG